MKKTYTLFAIALFSSSFICVAETEQSTSAEETVESSEATEESSSSSETSESSPNLVGPTGVTGTIRRSDRRQDRRLEKDIEDAIERRPRTQSVR